MDRQDELGDPHAVTLLPGGAAAAKGSVASPTSVGDGPRRDRTDDRAPPPSLGRYRLLGVLGRGGMGTVHDAIDDRIGRSVALKLLHADLGGRHAERLVREAQALARLSHPSVVQVYEVGREAGRWFIAMERVGGRTLREWQDGPLAAAEPKSVVPRRARPTWRACLAAYLQAGEGLAAAHRAGLTHRDFKPGNCIIDDQGRVRVLDFGLACDSGDASVESSTSEPVPTARALLQVSSLTRTGEVLGTLGYMPIEQLEGRGADARSDQWSFCASLYEAVYGERPFAADTAASLTLELMRGNIRPAPQGSDVPRRLRRALVRGLAKDPGARWPSMDALLVELRAIAGARRMRSLAIAGGLVVTGAGLAGVLLQPSPAAEPPRPVAPEATGLALVDGHSPSAEAVALRERAEQEFATTLPSRAEALVTRLDELAPDGTLPADPSLAAEVLLWRARVDGDSDEAVTRLRKSYFLAREADVPSIEARAAGAMAGNMFGAHAEGVNEWLRLAWVAVERIPEDRSAAIEVAVTAAYADAITWEVKNDLATAQQMLEFADAVVGRVELDDDAYVALQLVRLAAGFSEIDRHERAFHWAHAAWELLQATEDADHPLLAKVHEQLGLALHPPGTITNCELALPHFEAAQAAHARHGDADAVARVGFEIADCLRSLRRHEAALLEIRAVASHWSAHDAPRTSDVQNAHLLAGHVLYELGRDDEAIVEYERLLALVDVDASSQSLREQARISLELARSQPQAGRRRR